MDALCSHDPTILQPIDLSSTSEMTLKVHHQSLRAHPKPICMKPIRVLHKIQIELI